jgi:plastocyanin
VKIALCIRRKTAIAACLLGIGSAVLAACGGGGGSGMVVGGGNGGNPTPNPSPTPGPVVHINFFGGANGSIDTPPFSVVSGFTQQAHAQVMAFTPGEQITVTNNDTTAHTINVFSAYPTPGPQSTAAVPNGGVLGPGYQSGVLQPGQTTSMLNVMNTPGNLFIICGIHFSSGMQDGIVVQVGATPGPEATPTVSGGGCHGYGC